MGGYPRDLVQNFHTSKGSPTNPLNTTNRNSKQTHGSGLHIEFQLRFQARSISDHGENKVKFTLVGSPCYTTAVILDLHFPKLHNSHRSSSNRNIPQCPILVIKPCIGKMKISETHKFYTHIKKVVMATLLEDMYF